MPAEAPGRRRARWTKTALWGVDINRRPRSGADARHLLLVSTTTAGGPSSIVAAAHAGPRR